MRTTSFISLIPGVMLTLLTRYTSVKCTLRDFGADEGHQTTPSSDSGSSPALAIDPPFGFYGSQYNTVFVNNDGSVSFTSPADYQDTTTVTGTVTAVCGFCSDIDITKSGTVWYGITTSLSERQTIADDVRIFSDFPSDYLPSWVMVATWDGVASFVNTDGQVNTFQVIIATDGSYSVVQLLYDVISWVEDTIDLSEFYDDVEPPEIRAQCGFLAGDGTTAYLLPGSRTETLLNISHVSNIGVPGTFVFRVDQGIVQPTTPSVSELSSASPTAVDVTSESTQASKYSSTQASTDSSTQASTDSSTQDSTYSSTQALTYSSTQASTCSSTQASTFSSTEASTDSSTQASTFSSTQASTGVSTQASTNPSTQASTDPSTQASTDPSTQASTNSSTQASTDPSTQALTDTSTQASTDPSPQASTDSSTQASTDTSTEASTDPSTQASTDSSTPALPDFFTEASTDSFTQASKDFSTKALTDYSTQASTDSSTQASTDSSSSAAANQVSELVSTFYTLYSSSVLSSPLSSLMSLQSIPLSSSSLPYSSLFSPYSSVLTHSTLATSSSSMLSISLTATSTVSPVSASSSQQYETYVHITTGTPIPSLETGRDNPIPSLDTEDITGAMTLGHGSNSPTSADALLSDTSELSTGTAFRDVIHPSESLLSLNDLLLTSEDSLRITISSPSTSRVSLSSSLTSTLSSTSLPSSSASSLSSLPSSSSSSTVSLSPLSSSSFVSILSPSSSLLVSTLSSSSPASPTSSLLSTSLNILVSSTPVLSTNNKDTSISTANNIHTYSVQTAAVMDSSSLDSYYITSVTIEDKTTTIMSPPDVLMSTVSQTDDSDQGINPGSCVAIAGTKQKSSSANTSPTTAVTKSLPDGTVTDTEGQQDQVLGYPFLTLTSVQSTVAPYIVALFIAVIALVTIGMIQTSLWLRLIRKLSRREKLRRRYERPWKHHIPMRIVTTRPTPYQYNNTSIKAYN